LRRYKNQERSGISLSPGPRNPRRQTGSPLRCHHSLSFTWRISRRPEENKTLKAGGSDNLLKPKNRVICSAEVADKGLPIVTAPILSHQGFPTVEKKF